MICKYCGKELPEGSRFCSECGADLSVTEEKVPEAEEITMQNSEGVPEQAPVSQPPKKKGKGLIVAIIAVVVVAVIAVASFFLFREQITELTIKFSSPEAQQLYTYKKLVEKTSENYGDVIDKTDDKYSGKGELTVELGDSAKTLISAAGIDISEADSLKVAYDTNVSADIMSVALAFSYNGNELIKADAVVDIKNQVATFSVPELNDKALKIDLSEYMESVDAGLQMNTSDIADKLPGEEVFESLLKKYLEIALKELKGVTKETADLSIGDLTVKSTLLTTEFTEKMAGDIAVKVMKAVKEDDEIKEQFISICEVAGIDGEESYKDFIESIDESIESADTAELTDDVIFTLKTWVNSSFDILAAELSDESSVLFVGSVENNEATAAEISLEVDGYESFKITADGTEKRNIYDGDIAVWIDGEDMLKIKCEGVDAEADSFVGKMTVTSSYLGESLGTELASMAEITLEGSCEGEKNSLVIGIGALSTQLGKITFTAEPHEFSAPELHTNTVDDADVWAGSVNTESIMTKLSESGLMDIVNTIVMNSLGGSSDEDYYEDYTDYDYGYDAGYTDGYFDSAWGDEYGTCYGDSAEDDSDEYMQGYKDGYDDGYNDGLAEAAA